MGEGGGPGIGCRRPFKVKGHYCQSIFPNKILTFLAFKFVKTRERRTYNLTTINSP